MMFKVKVVSNNHKKGSDGVYVCQHPGQYTPVVLMIGLYTGGMDKRSLGQSFYAVEGHEDLQLCGGDEPLLGEDD